MFASHRQKENIPLLAMGKRATNEGKTRRVGRLLVPCDIATCAQEVLSQPLAIDLHFLVSGGNWASLISWGEQHGFAHH